MMGTVATQDVGLRLGISTLGADGGRSGIGRYVTHLLDEIGTAAGRPAHVEVMVTEGEEQAFPAPYASRLTLPARTLNPLWGVAWSQLALGRACRRGGLDVLFLPAANRRATLFPTVPTVGTVHDLSSLHVKGKYDRARELYITRALPAMIRKLTHVITPSEASKRDVVEYAGVSPQNVSVIPNGVDHDVYRPGDRAGARERLRASRGIEGPYLLYVSRLEHPGKNHVRLIQAFERLRERYGIPHRLVLAGSDWTRAGEIHRAAARSTAREVIDFLGFVTQAELVDLNAGADLVVFPSLYEGFGIPVLEAMASGTPVAAAATSSLPEVGGDAALYFDPLDPDSMAETILGILENTALRQDMIRRGAARSLQFSWRRTARETLDRLYKTAVENTP